jgi:hypothetical protein
LRGSGDSGFFIECLTRACTRPAQRARARRTGDALVVSWSTNMHRIWKIIAMSVVLSGYAPLSMASDSVCQSLPQRGYEDELFAAIARAHELLDLGSVSLPPGYREIWIRGHLSNVCCWPTPMLRLVEGPSDIRGELLLFRRLLLRSGNPAPRADERCVPLREQHVCVRPWTLRSGDWATVARTLEELGAWSIAESCEITRNADGSGGMTTIGDAGNLYIQRLVGTEFSSYSCNAPNLRATPVGRKANAIYEYFCGLGGPIPHEHDAIAR